MCPTRLPTSPRGSFRELSHGCQAWASVGRSYQLRPSWWGVKGPSDSAWLGDGWPHPEPSVPCFPWHRPEVCCPGPHISVERPGAWSPANHPEPCKAPRAQVPTLEFWEIASVCVCVYPSSSYPFSLTFLEVPGTEGKLQAGRQTSQERAEAAVHRENFFLMRS